MKFEDKFNLNRVDPLIFTKADVNLTIGIAPEDSVVLPSIYSSRHIQRALALAPSLEIKEVKWFDHPDIVGVQISSDGNLRTNFKYRRKRKLPAIRNLPVIEVGTDPSDHQGFCREIIPPTAPNLCVLGLGDSEPDVSGVWEMSLRDGTKQYWVAIDKETNICSKLDQVPGQLGTDRVVGSLSSARTHVLASYVKNGALQGWASIRKILDVIPAASSTGMKYEVCLPEGIHKLVPVSGEPVCYVRVSRTGLESWRREFMGAVKAATTWNKAFHAAQEVLRGKVIATLLVEEDPAPTRASGPPPVATDVTGIYKVHYQIPGALPKFVEIGRSYETNVRDTIEQVKVASRTPGNCRTAVLVLDGKVTAEVIESK